MDRELFILETSKLNINLTDEMLNQLEKYYELLVEWNEKINLTAIIKPEEIILKHFIDSLTINKYIEYNKNLTDVGTGAGFPGIPIKIYRPDIKVTLVDSLNKRINFLNEVIEKLKLEDIFTVHSRIEDFGRNSKYREKFDYVTARAVANMTVLSEYLMPICKVNGKCICMKANKGEEIENSKIAISILGGEIEAIKEFTLPDSDIKRTLIIIKKAKETPSSYPRKAGTPSKQPIQ